MMEKDEKPLPRIPFPADTESRAFIGAMVMVVRERTDALMTNVLSQENIQSFYHGEGWIDQGHDGPTNTGTFELSQVEHVIKVEDISSSDFTILYKFIESMAQSLFENMMKLLYVRVNEAVESVGNIVSAAESGSTAEAFLEMLRRLEFGVDNKGKVSLPQIHIHPDNVAKLEAELANQSRAFQLEAEVIKSQKIADALKREQARLARFKGFNAAR
jgi:hypothetical protein